MELLSYVILLSSSVAISRSKIIFPLCAFAYNFLLYFLSPRSPDPTQGREIDCIWLYFPLAFLTSLYSLTLHFSHLLKSFVVFFFNFLWSLSIFTTLKPLKLVTHKPTSASLSSHTIRKQHSLKRIILFFAKLSPYLSLPLLIIDIAILLVMQNSGVIFASFFSFMLNWVMKLCRSHIISPNKENSLMFSAFIWR